RKVAARHPQLPNDCLTALASDESPVVRDRVRERLTARDPAAAAAMIETKKPDIRRLGAASDAADPKLLASLASDPDIGVRRAVAANPATPAEAVEHLAQDDDVGVRVAVAGRSDPNPALARLIKDEALEVR